MKNRITSIIVVISIIMGLIISFPITTIAATSGKCGANLTWTFNGGVLTISGTGAMYNYSDSSYVPWYSQKENIKTVNISNGVTRIGKYAFYGCKNLTGITIPSDVESIENYAFWHCSNLTNVTIGNSVTSISENVFYACVKLTNIVVNEDNTTYCSIDGNLFNKDKTQLIQYAIGKTSNSFVVPNGVMSVGSYAFKDCSNLTSITIPDSVTSVESSAFRGCSRLTNIVVDENNTAYCSIDGNLFNKDKTQLMKYAVGKTNSSYVIPYCVTTIGSYAFEKCSSLTSITIPDGVTRIGGFAFGYCSSLINITLPDSMTSIGVNAFWHCSSLTSVTLPDSMTSIGVNAFYGCSNLVNITIPNGVTSIEDQVFGHCYNLTNITIPDSVTSIKLSAFYLCSKLRNVTIGKNVENIGVQAFYGCSRLTDITIPDGVTSIGRLAFMQCSSLTYITIPHSVNTIGDSAFYGCSTLTDVYYAGSESDWSNISIGSSNSCLTNATIHYNHTGNTDDYLTDDSIDDYIIDEVKKYTSSGDLAQYNAIMSSDASWEEKFRRLNEFFNNEGLTDIKEGTQYLTESNSYRYAYNCLTTNEMYGAFNYYNWLYSTKSGLAARSALYTSGLIFNYEVFSYMDLSTYTENDYPGIKKNKTLLKEIMGNDSNSTLCDIFDYSNKTAKFLKNIVSLNKITMDNEMEALMDKIINSTSKEQSQKLQKEFVEKIIAVTGTTNSINMFSDNFADALDSASDILSFAGATVEDIVALSNLDADIELYKKNSKFLYTIYSNPDVSFEMRLAAYQLYDEIENGYYNKVVSMLNNVIDFSLDKMYTDKSMLRTFLESQGISESGSGLFADALGTIKLATYITNIIIDTGDFVKQVAYTQGYAELATLYSLKLEEDKQAFLANETAENAWNFFEDYTMLWKLRYNGEQQYLDMSKVKVFIFDSIKTYKYEEKKELVQDNLEMLNKCKFKLAAETTIPKSVQYEKKSVVKCPVDVYVYNSEGTLIATLKDGEESNVTNNYGRFAVVKESYSGEYAKVICQSTTEDLTIKMIAVDDGLVDYQSLTTASTDVKTMDKLIVGTGNSIDVNNDSYSVDTNSDGNADINGTLIIKDTNSYVAVESLSTADDNITLISGQTKTIGVTITPANSTNTALEWISLDKGVATVQNGLIKAIGSGTTTIIVRACDSNEIEREIVVTVLDKMEYEVLSHICNENSLVGKINVKNNVDSKMVATMYVAIYRSDGSFKDVSLTPIELDAKGETVIDINIENYVYTNDDYIKIFIWDENLMPFCKTEKTLLVSVE